MSGDACNVCNPGWNGEDPNDMPVGAALNPEPKLILRPTVPGCCCSVDGNAAPELADSWLKGLGLGADMKGVDDVVGNAIGCVAADILGGNAATWRGNVASMVLRVTPTPHSIGR